MSEPENLSTASLLESLGRLDEGLTIFDSGLSLVVASERFFELFDLPRRFRKPGTTAEEIIRFNARRGEYGPGDSETQVQERIARYKRIRTHRYRHARPDGQVIEVRGSPLPDGGTISSYRDVTSETRLAEQQSNDHRIAHQLQASLMPSAALLKQISADCGLSVRALCRQADEVGGDFWGIQKQNNRSVAFYVIDTVGHGFTASHNAFRIHTLVAQYFSTWESLEGWVDWVNRQMLDLLDVGHFATYVFGVIDLNEKQLTYSAGGYPSFLVGQSGSNTEPAFADTSGLPLGISSDKPNVIRTINLPHDWILLFYSDALIEAEVSERQYLDEDVMGSIFSRGCAGGHVDYLFATLEEVVGTWFPGGITDDLTLICMGDLSNDQRQD
jgi:hypothetical protein